MATIAGETLNQPALAVAGAAAIVADLAGTGLFVYRGSRQNGSGIATSFGRALKVTIRLFLDS